MPTTGRRCDKKKKANVWGEKYLVCLYIYGEGKRPLWLQRLEWRGTGDEIRQIIRVDQIEFCLLL